MLILSILITLIAYGAFPLIFAKVRSKTISQKKYVVICYVVNFVVMAAFIALLGESSTGFPYLLWTGVFSAIGVKILRKNYVLEGSQPAPEPDRTVYLNKSPASPKASEPTTAQEQPSFCFCRKCGSKLPVDSNFCTKCGTEMVKVTPNEQTP